MRTATVKKEEQKPAEEEGLELLDHFNLKRKSSHPLLFKYVSLLVLVLQNACHVLVTRFALTRDKNLYPPFSKSVAVFLNELVKFGASLTLFFISTKDLRKSFEILHHHFVSNFLDTLKVGVPAIIYVIQNVLILLALENLDSGTYMITYQLKILTTAMFSVLILNRKLSIPQWVALLILVTGVALCNKQKCDLTFLSPADALRTTATILAPKNKSTIEPGFQALPSPDTIISNTQEKEQNPILGLVYVLIACFLSGFAGIYFEKILKGSEVSLWLRNVQLSLLSLPFAFIFIGVQEGTNVFEKGLLLGFDGIVWLSVFLQAIGGLVVAVVIKYADNILKAFATSVAIVLATVASILLLNTEPKLMFFVGAALVITSVVFYGLFPYRKSDGIVRIKKVKTNGEEMQVIVSNAENNEQQGDEESGQTEEETKKDGTEAK